MASIQVQGRNVSSEKSISRGVCCIEERTIAIFFPVRTQCPPEWTMEYEGFYSKLAPIRVQGRNVSSEKPISCGVCFTEERTSATVFPARTQCPPEWTMEYEGYLATKDALISLKGNIICLDSHAKANENKILVKTGAPWESEHVSNVKMGCGILPCDKFKKDTLIPCVVCSY